MFDLVNKHKRILQFVLALIFLPFAFFGVDSYFRSGDSGNHVATVGGQKISQQEFSQALQERQNALQKMVGSRVDPALLDSPDLRFAVLDGIIRQRILINQAVRGGLLVPDEQLQQVIAEQPAFQEDGKFSHARYEELLKRQGMTAVSFENSLRRDLMLQSFNSAYNGTAIVADSVAERLLRINAQQREVRETVLEPAKFLSQVKLEEGAARKYYDAHQGEFQVPEQARVEYVVLSLDGIAAQMSATPEEVKQYYEQNLKQYARGDERQASHILITVDPKASADEKKAAREKAEQLLKQLKQNPASFADLARKNSQDPGSAAKGGDLGFTPRGTMVKPFDDALFSMKVGEIKGLVETQFGYHIIRLTAVRGQGYDEVRNQVELGLKRQKASKEFARLAEQFNNIVFEQGDTLKPAADMLKTNVQTGPWVSRRGSDNKLFNNPKLLQAIFSEDTIKNKRNTEVVDVGSNTLVAARVVDHKPPTTRPFEEVSADITRRLTQQQAAQLAARQGRELLAKLEQGKDDVTWGTSKLVSRENAQGYTGPALLEIFKVDTGKLPAYAGVEQAEGAYALLKITRVVEADKTDPTKRKAATDELRQVLGQEELNAYVASAKLKSDVKILQDRIEKKQ